MWEYLIDGPDSNLPPTESMAWTDPETSPLHWEWPYQRRIYYYRRGSWHVTYQIRPEERFSRDGSRMRRIPEEPPLYGDTDDSQYRDYGDSWHIEPFKDTDAVYDPSGEALHAGGTDASLTPMEMSLRQSTRGGKKPVRKNRKRATNYGQRFRKGGVKPITVTTQRSGGPRVDHLS